MDRQTKPARRWYEAFVRGHYATYPVGSHATLPGVLAIAAGLQEEGQDAVVYEGRRVVAVRTAAGEVLWVRRLLDTATNVAEVA